MVKLAVIVFFPVLSVNAAAETLETKNYTVKIKTLCAEGNVSCDKVSYYGISKVSGRSITLVGKTKHTRCKDGITPCQFLGYEFRNGSYTYFVGSNGELRVTKNGNRTVVDESGKWAK